MIETRRGDSEKEREIFQSWAISVRKNQKEKI